MKIVVIASLAESLINFRGKLLEEFIKQDLDVICIAPFSDDNGTMAKLHQMGCQTENLDLERTGQNPLKDYGAYKSCRDIIKKHNPDYVLSYTTKPVLYGTLAAASAGVKSISVMITGLGSMFIETGLEYKIKRIMLLYLFKRALSKCKNVFFQNSDDQNYFLEKKFITQEQIRRINGSGVDTSYFAFNPQPPKENLKFLFIGRLIKDKGIIEYFKAAEIVKNKYPNVEVDVVGWMENKPSSVKKEELDYWVNSGVINYLGKSSDVRPHINNCDVYVLPSYREGTPRTVLEAMSIGRPIITTNAPGCKETVEEGNNGFLVPVKNVEKLAERMEYFIQNPDEIERMGKNSRKIAENKYDVNSVNKVITESILENN